MPTERDVIRMEVSLEPTKIKVEPFVHSLWECGALSCDDKYVNGLKNGEVSFMKWKKEYSYANSKHGDPYTYLEIYFKLSGTTFEKTYTQATFISFTDDMGGFLAVLSIMVLPLFFCCYKEEQQFYKMLRGEQTPKETCYNMPGNCWESFKCDELVREAEHKMEEVISKEDARITALEKRNEFLEMRLEMLDELNSRLDALELKSGKGLAFS